jgi:gliding motility-associated-like protein
MKVIMSFLFFLLGINLIDAQCGSVIDCNANTGIFSNDNATDIAYDNMCSGFHTTCIKEPSGNWKVWGEYAGNEGDSNVLSPLDFNVANYPVITGTIYKIAIGSNFGLYMQLIVLTSDGLFVLGTQGTVLSASLTNSTTFQKITVNGKTDGLPLSINPADVKMMFATSNTLMITTCNGEVFVLSQDQYVRGDGENGNELQWSRVMQDATTPLNNVIVSRGNSRVGFALKSNGTLWTWGSQTFLGDGTSSLNRNYATQMILPSGLSGIKMIQCTSDFFNDFGDNIISYYILGTDKKVYSLGTNNKGQLGDRTAVDRYVWVNAKNPDNSIITDAAWISGNEHDENLSSLAVLKTNGLLYTCGNNSYYMIGRTNGGTLIEGDVNYLDLPAGITSSDFITYAEAGGHTCALIKQCSSKYGYVGHRIRGSIGDGSSTNETIPSYDFTSPPAIAVCGAQYVLPTITSNGPICPGQDAIFTIVGASGDVLSYTINSGTTQTITIDTSGSAQIVLNSVVTNQTIDFTHIFSNSNCSYDISLSANVLMNMPQFTQVAPICEGDTINPLPTTSDNGISGSWSPTFDNMHTTQYTFTPTAGACAGVTQMTVVVNPKLSPVFPIFNSLCYGDSQFILPTLSNNGFIGTWSPSINSSQTTTYLFTPNNGQCATTASAQVQIYDDFDFEIATFCENNDYFLKIVPNGFTIETANFIWKYNNSNVGSDVVFNLSNYLLSNAMTVPFPISFLVTVWNSNNCQKTKSITVENSYCDVPNVITPNNDGWNDSFDLKLLHVKNILIYNRWGLKIYDKNNYLDEWHGQTNSGKILPDGVYFYVLEFASEEAKTGWVLLKN